MSNYLGIATVTETLRQVLNKAVADDVPGAVATAVRPSGLQNTGTGGGLPAVGVNVFLYQIMPNAALRNMDLPTRRSDGTAQQRPKAAIDLHYILSVYGAEATLEPQRVMGSVVRTMQSRPMLTRAEIDTAVATAGFLTTSDLSSDIELVKFVPLALTLDELSRVWSVYFQTSYALSVCYQASVVVLEESTAIVTAPPPRTLNIMTLPIALPVIDTVSPQPAIFGGTVTLSGANVGRNTPFVTIGDAGVVAATVVSPNQIQLVLPGTTKAGVSAIRVSQKIDFGTGDPSEPHDGFQSNVAAMALAPTILSTNPASSVARGATLTVNFDTPVGQAQNVALLLGSRSVPIPYRPASGPATATSFDFPIPADMPTGDALLRLQVDGVESTLAFDATTKLYTQPKVTIT